jgi:hypothetical protein
LHHHPGDLAASKTLCDLVPADEVIHWFRSDRPGQRRGIPELAAVLPLLTKLRRYTQAPEPIDKTELKQVANMVANGWQLMELQDQFTVPEYAELKREILSEIAHGLNLPYYIVARNSSDCNASEQLDHQIYLKNIRIEQNHLATAVLERIFATWVGLARITPKLSELQAMQSVPHVWVFNKL